jgi:hypothetical protein
LEEENLMTPELLTVEHAMALRAQPGAEAAIASLMLHAEALIQQNWGAPLSSSGKSYGPDSYRHFSFRPAEGDATTKPDRWGSVVLEWAMYLDSKREEPRNAWAFLAGATMRGKKDNPANVAGNEEWLAERREDGFEYDAGWGLFRYLYPEELLSGTTFEDQFERLAGWVVESFRILEGAPPRQ